MMQSISANWVNFLISLLSGLALIPIVQFGLWISREVKQRLKRGKYSLSGTWIGPCKLPHYPPDVVALEIYRLDVSGERVTFTFFNYLPEKVRADVHKYTGEGIYRGNLLSAFYYLLDPFYYES